jgi:HK97 family phage major capsid protein
VDIERLINQIETELSVAKRKRDQAQAEIEIILNTASKESRTALGSDEDKRVEALFGEIAEAKAEIAGIDAKLAQAQRAQKEEKDSEQYAERKHDTGVQKPAYDRVARVGNEERTYRIDKDRSGGKFLRDVARQFLYRDLEAENRLVRHMNEERVERGEYLQRAAGDAPTTAFTGLVVPQYLTDMYAPAVAALRPFADICNSHDLPASGMTVNISRITTATSVANQASELAAVSATSIDDTLLTENVQTAAGQQTLSRQALDRGTGVEDVVMSDLMRRYATNLDSTLLNQATTGLTNIATATAYTDATPTGPELYPKLLGAAAGVEAALLAQAVPTHAVMHSRRWYWLQSQLTTSWPMFGQMGVPAQTVGQNNGIGYNAGLRGQLPNGLGVVVDNNIATNLGAGTNEDEIYIVPRDECHLWEDPNAPLFIRAEQAAAAALGVLMVLYGYYAYSFRRYSNGMGKVNGTGLITPTF